MGDEINTKEEENIQLHRKIREDPDNEGLLAIGMNKCSTSDLFIEEKSNYLQLLETRFYQILLRKELFNALKITLQKNNYTQPKTSCLRWYKL